MSTGERRLDRLLPALNAKERAILMLRDFKAGKDQDRTLLRMTPDRQVDQLNRLIGLMNAANSDLGLVIVVIRERVRVEALRLGWLEWARVCALEAWAVRAHFNTSAREPITESGYRRLEAEAREELLPLDECATIVTEAHAWDDGDCETDEYGDRVPTEAAWDRVYDQKLVELRRLVAAGTLTGTGKGKRLQVKCGSFYDWLGEPVPVVPDFGMDFEVRPDGLARDVERDRRDHALIRKVLDRGACKVDLPLDVESPLVLDPPEAGFGLEVARTVAVMIRAGIRENWRELRAIEEQVDAMTEEYAGEDVLQPLFREYLDETKASLRDLSERAQAYTGPFDLPEPDDELRATVQRVIDKEIAHLPLA